MNSTKQELIDICTVCILLYQDCIKVCNECDIKCKDESVCSITQDCIVKIENGMESSKNCVDICNNILSQKSSLDLNEKQVEAIQDCIKQTQECLKICQVATDKILSENYYDGCNWPIDIYNKCISACDEVIESFE